MRVREMAGAGVVLQQKIEPHALFVTAKSGRTSLLSPSAEKATTVLLIILMPRTETAARQANPPDKRYSTTASEKRHVGPAPPYGVQARGRITLAGRSKDLDRKSILP